MKTHTVIIDPSPKELDRLIAQKLRDAHGRRRLHRYSDPNEPPELATWTLSGITPVGFDFVQKELLEKGIEVRFSRPQFKLFAATIALKAPLAGRAYGTCLVSIITRASSDKQALANGLLEVQRLQPDIDVLGFSVVKVPDSEVQQAAWIPGVQTLPQVKIIP